MAKASPLFQPINLKRPITPATNVDLSDTGRVKNALNDLGLMDTRDHGLDAFPDQPMINGIRAFQRQEGLREDGEMKPDGETAQRLNLVMAKQEVDQPDDRPGNNDSDGVQVAAAPAVVAPLLGAAARTLLGQAGRATAAGAAVGTAGALTGDTPQDDRNTSKPSQNQRISPAPKMPPPPDFEPPDEKLPDKTESLPQPVELPNLSQPLPEIKKLTVFVLPPVKPGEFGDGIVERKGNEATRKELERFRDYFRKKGWLHIAGGRFAADDPDVLNGVDDAKPGGERGEFHVKGHFGSLKGGRFTDLTFQDENGRIIHVQSVDVDKNGKPTQRELDAAEAIRRATGHSVLLIPKGAQLDRLKRRRRR